MFTSFFFRGTMFTS